MEFDKSRVYTALNADELKAGDKVIVANSLSYLKHCVECDECMDEIVSILSDDNQNRFLISGSRAFALAYLVERAETEHDCQSCKYKNCGFKDFNTKNECDRWEAEPKTEPRAEKCEDCIKAYTDYLCVANVYHDATGQACKNFEAEKKYRPFANTDELIEEWNKKLGCRDATGLVKPYIWVRSKFNKDHKGVLISNFFDTYVELNVVQCFLSRLFEEYTFLDGSVCGVEE